MASESDLIAKAYFARLNPPPDFCTEWARESGQCGGTCADFGHQFRDDGAGDCRCLSLKG